MVDPEGSVTPFARGPGGYHEDPGAEAYLAMSRAGKSRQAGMADPATPFHRLFANASVENRDRRRSAGRGNKPTAAGPLPSPVAP